MRCSFLILVLLLLTGVVCQGQVSEQQAKEKAATATRREENYPESHLLRAHRREDLEDDLFRAQIKVLGRIAKAAYFYELTNEGSFVLSPDELWTLFLRTVTSVVLWQFQPERVKRTCLPALRTLTGNSIGLPAMQF